MDVTSVLTNQAQAVTQDSRFISAVRKEEGRLLHSVMALEVSMTCAATYVAVGATAMVSLHRVLLHLQMNACCSAGLPLGSGHVRPDRATQWGWNLVVRNHHPR